MIFQLEVNSVYHIQRNDNIKEKQHNLCKFLHTQFAISIQTRNGSSTEEATPAVPIISEAVGPGITLESLTHEKDIEQGGKTKNSRIKFMALIVRTQIYLLK